MPGRTAALTYLQRHWPRLRENQPLRTALESARFVDAAGTSNLKSPGELYDPEVELLAAVFRGQAGAFPAGAWQGLTLVHFPAQPEPLLVTEATARVDFSAQSETFIIKVSEHSPRQCSRLAEKWTRFAR